MNSLSRLNAIIRQIQDRTTRSNCSALFEEVDRLNRQHGNRPEMSALLNMIKSLGNYLYSRLDKSHPEALPLLQSIAETAESVLGQNAVDKSMCRNMVKKQMTQYRDLQNKLSSNPMVAVSEIENLKAVILSIDWEITDQTLNNFEVELKYQLEKFKAYNIHHTFLKMIQSIGRYVASHKARAHTDSIAYLRSVFGNFEQLIRTPDLTLKEKKRLLESDLKKFQAFNEKITRQSAPQAKALDPEEQENLPPALSHVKRSSDRSAGFDGDDSLTSLEEDLEPPDHGMETVSPARAGKRPPQTGSKDVMDDLFSIKESPADDLLDAIHLLDVQGSNPADQALHMLDTTNGSQSEGVKNYTPQRNEAAPIPEIGDRLDEFFNLETPPKPSDIEPEPQIHPAAIDSSVKDEPADMEEIVPFDYTDETNDTAMPRERPVPDETLVILERLKTAFGSTDQLSNPGGRAAASDDINRLKDQWVSDIEKNKLLDILADAVHLFSISGRSPKAAPKKKRFWQRFISGFSS